MISPSRRSFLGLALALPAAGCVSAALSPGTVDAFDLSPLPPRPGRGGGRQIVVPEPSTLRLLDSERIVVRPRPGEASYLGGAQLIDRLPRLLQARIVQSFENARRFRAVARPGEGVDPDLLLIVDIRSFGIDATGSGVAEIDLAARLVAARSGRLAASELFSIRAPASTEPRAALAALDSALTELLNRMVVWAARR